MPRPVLRLFPARLRAAAAALALIAPSFAGPFLAGTFLAGPFLAGPALARDLPAVATPFEVGDSRAGNYLAALVAGASRDTFAAATYFRETLRADPNNAELLDRAFLASLANGDMAEAFRYAEQLTRRQPNHPLAWLALAGRDFGIKRYGQARAALARSGPSRTRDITATLLTAWAHAGAKEGKQALAAVEKLTDPAFAVFRDFHAALILDQTGKRDEALARMKKAYEGEKQTLRLVDAYGRMLSAQSKREEALAVYRDFAKTLPRHPIVLSAIADLEAGKTLKPLIADAREGAGETLYGLGAAGGRSGDELASLVYYLRDAPQPVRSWPVGHVPDNQFDMTHALTEKAGEPILFVTACGLEPRLAKQFASVRQLDVFTVRTGPTSSRIYGAFLLSGSRGPVAPLGRCEG